MQWITKSRRVLCFHPASSRWRIRGGDEGAGLVRFDERELADGDAAGEVARGHFDGDIGGDGGGGVVVPAAGTVGGLDGGSAFDEVPASVEDANRDARDGEVVSDDDVEDVACDAGVAVQVERMDGGGVEVVGDHDGIDGQVALFGGGCVQVAHVFAAHGALAVVHRHFEAAAGFDLSCGGGGGDDRLARDDRFALHFAEDQVADLTARAFEHGIECYFHIFISPFECILFYRPHSGVANGHDRASAGAYSAALALFGRGGLPICNWVVTLAGVLPAENVRRTLAPCVVTIITR